MSIPTRYSADRKTMPSFCVSMSYLALLHACRSLTILEGALNLWSFSIVENK